MPHLSPPDSQFQYTLWHLMLMNDLHASQLPHMNRYPAINSILVMDNAAIHRGSRVRRLCRDAGVRLIYLPPYCPELNPIEVCFSQVKSNLRRTQALVNSSDPSWVIRKTTNDIVSPSLCRELYRHSGYSCPSAEEFALLSTQ